MSAPDGASHKAAVACAEWLAACLSYGWEKDDLDDLEALWWKYHDLNGTLMSGKAGR